MKLKPLIYQYWAHPLQDGTTVWYARLVDQNRKGHDEIFRTGWYPAPAAAMKPLNTLHRYGIGKAKIVVQKVTRVNDEFVEIARTKARPAAIPINQRGPKAARTVSNALWQVKREGPDRLSRAETVRVEWRGITRNGIR